MRHVDNVSSSDLIVINQTNIGIGLACVDFAGLNLNQQKLLFCTRQLVFSLYAILDSTSSALTFRSVATIGPSQHHAVNLSTGSSVEWSFVANELHNYTFQADALENTSSGGGIFDTTFKEIISILAAIIAFTVVICAVSYLLRLYIDLNVYMRR